jgi:hypothetical protein
VTSVIALLVASVALVLSVVSLLATGTLAVRTRAVSPRRSPAGDSELGELSIATLGSDVAELLSPYIDYTIPTDDGDADVRDMFLVDDGVLLLVSSGCASCRRILSESRDVLMAEQVRALVVAPSVARGREFLEKDCDADGIKYQVDIHGERSHAMGVLDFPATVIIRDGMIAKAYVTTTPESIDKVLQVSKASNLSTQSENQHQDVSS